MGANRLDPDSPRGWSGGVRLSMVWFGEEQAGEVGIRTSGDSPLAAFPGCGPGPQRLDAVLRVCGEDRCQGAREVRIAERVPGVKRLPRDRPLSGEHDDGHLAEYQAQDK